MFKKLAGVLVVVSLMVTGVMFSFATATPDPKKVELKNLMEQRNMLHETIKKNINEQKEIMKTLKSEIVKVEKTTPDKKAVKAKNKVVRDKIKAIKDSNSTINATRIELLTQVKVLDAKMKELRTEYKAANTAKDTSKMSSLLDNMLSKFKEIISNVTQRADIRTQMTANMKK